MTHCVFCQAAGHAVPAVFVLEDRLTVAIIDLRQPHDGHVLVMPRTHVASFDNLDKETAAELAWSTVRVTRAVRRAYQPEGLNLWQSNGAAAGQEVFHVHIHVLPRDAGDGLLRVYPAPPRTFAPTDEALAKIGERIRRELE
jgi:histidine triad (HIT) family protein